jgi:hypothetical protein
MQPLAWQGRQKGLEPDGSESSSRNTTWSISDRVVKHAGVERGL